jgi:hypothetical protein
MDKDNVFAPSPHVGSADASRRSEGRWHALKCWPEFFKHLWSGEKTFEIRKDDRSFEAGDRLILREWTERNGYSGRWIECDVTFLLGGIWPGLAPGYVCMSIKELERSQEALDEPRGLSASEEPCSEAVDPNKASE